MFKVNSSEYQHAMKTWTRCTSICNTRCVWTMWHAVYYVACRMGTTLMLADCQHLLIWLCVASIHAMPVQTTDASHSPPLGSRYLVGKTLTCLLMQGFSMLVSPHQPPSFPVACDTMQ